MYGGGAHVLGVGHMYWGMGTCTGGGAHVLGEGHMYWGRGTCTGGMGTCTGGRGTCTGGWGHMYRAMYWGGGGGVRSHVLHAFRNVQTDE